MLEPRPAFRTAMSDPRPHPSPRPCDGVDVDVFRFERHHHHHPKTFVIGYSLTIGTSERVDPRSRLHLQKARRRARHDLSLIHI